MKRTRPYPYRIWYRWHGCYMNHNRDRHAMYIQTLEDARILAQGYANNPEIDFVEIRQNQSQVEVVKGSWEVA
jgi:hypothetical protein